MIPRVLPVPDDPGGPPARLAEGRVAVRRLLLAVTWSGLLASLFGFLAAYWAISRFAPRAYHYVFTSLGLAASAYGFYQAFRTIRRWRVSVGNAPVALGFTSAGLVSAVYGFVQAFRGILIGTSGSGRMLAVALVTTGLAGALYGFARAFQVIIEESGRPTARR